MKHVFCWYDRTESEPQGQFKYCPFCQSTLSIAEIDHRLRPACAQCGFIQFRNPAPTVSIMIVDEGQVVLGKRGGPPGRGQWALPSGYVEFEDDFLSAAVQEAKEETGLAVKLEAILNVASSFLSPRYHFLGIYLLARPVGGVLAAGDDLEEVNWYPLPGPLPEMAFEEDRAAITQYFANSELGLSVGTNHRADIHIIRGSEAV